MLQRDLVYSNVLFKLEGLDEAILDNFCQFITSVSGMLDVEVTKQWVFFGGGDQMFGFLKLIPLI